MKPPIIIKDEFKSISKKAWKLIGKALKPHNYQASFNYNQAQVFLNFAHTPPLLTQDHAKDAIQRHFSNYLAGGIEGLKFKVLS